MTRRYDVRTGMLDNDPDAGQPREQLVPGWRVPGSTRYDYDLRIGDAERDATMAQLREHFEAALAEYRAWRAPFCDPSGELLPKYQPAPMSPTFVDADEAGVFSRGEIPVPRGPVETW